MVCLHRHDASKVSKVKQSILSLQVTACGCQDDGRVDFQAIDPPQSTTVFVGHAKPMIDGQIDTSSRITDCEGRTRGGDRDFCVTEGGVVYCQ